MGLRLIPRVSQLGAKILQKRSQYFMKNFIGLKMRE